MTSEGPPIRSSVLPGSRSYRLALRSEPNTLAAVRRAVHVQLRDWGCPELSHPAAMCVTELLSNVHKHVKPPECVLTLQDIPGGIRISVADHGTSLPIMREPGDFCESGRGLFLLSGTADAWGAEPTESGKTVWFDLYTERTR